MKNHEVVVTGWGLVAPTATGAKSLFASICNKQSCIDHHPEFAQLGFPCTAAGFISPEQWEVIFSSIRSKTLSKQEALAEFVTRQALEHADVSIPNLTKYPTGLFVGANKFCVNGDSLSNASDCMINNGKIDLDRYIEQCHPNDSYFSVRVDQQTRHLANVLGVRNFISTHSDACAAGTTAIGAGYRAIAAGHIDVAVCGAVELMANELPYFMFHSIGALCDKPDWPAQQQSRPFTKSRSGFVLSEGAAMMVLESKSHAKKRGAISRGKILGFHNSCEAEKITSSRRDGSKYAKCMLAALEDAQLSPSNIDHINVHGTSTKVNDDCEAKAILDIFSENLNTVSLTANKSSLGHSLASSGAIEAILSFESLNHGVALPTINYDDKEAEYPQLKFLKEPLHQTINTVISNSFGFGGVNSSIVLGKSY